MAILTTGGLMVFLQKEQRSCFDMLHEYALDPSVLTSWQSFRYFFESFGVSEGRLISQYPKKWKRLVYEACSDCKDIERLRIEQRLADIDEKLFKCGAPFDPAVPWFVNAEANRSAFCAVISSANPNRHDNVLVADDIQRNDPHWNVPREKPIERNAAAMADCTAKLLAHAREILFVDPHFDPAKSRYRNTLKAFLEKVPDPAKVKRIEYHLSNRLSWQFFQQEYTERVSRLLRQGVTVTFIRWQEAGGGDSLHPRYILTDLGGIRFEHGLDEEPDGPTVDVSLLDRNLYNARWKDYQRETSTFSFVDELEVNGTR
jgi:hypothetical protein